jgi:hypothetical protein
MSKKKPALIAEINSDAAWLRYLIKDERGRFWTGRGFSKDKGEALTYADPLVVTRDMRRILRKRCKRLIRHRLVVPVAIDVYAEGPIDVEEMRWFLSQHCFVGMSQIGTDVGPGESVVLPSVDWKKLRRSRKNGC